jgi:hypothetical protein
MTLALTPPSRIDLVDPNNKITRPWRDYLAFISELNRRVAGHVIEDEGIPLAQRDFLNFVGAGVTVTDTGSKTEVTINASAVGVTVPVDFGAGFTDKAQAVVSAPWVNATTRIVADVMTPTGTDPDEMYLIDFQPVISDRVAGVGFTLTLYTRPEARGVYHVSCIGA